MSQYPAPESVGLLTEEGYQRLVGAWSDLETALNTYLHHPEEVDGFAEKTAQFRSWLETLVANDSDTALYLMFQLAATSTVGYSASHALVCSTLCQLVAHHFKLPDTERQTLIHAALTMNVAMTELQDALALQVERPTTQQEERIRTHAERGAQLLQTLGVTNDTWIEVVRHHHEPPAERLALDSLSEVERITRILASIDRYAAMISPRKSRPGRTVADSLRAIMGQRFDPRDEVGHALADMAGLYPPGTLVKLDTQEIAIVLRRTQTTNHPIVAGIVKADRQPYDIPPLYLTAKGQPRILAGLPWTALEAELSHRTRVSLGLFTARQGMRKHA